MDVLKFGFIVYSLAQSFILNLANWCHKLVSKVFVIYAFLDGCHEFEFLFHSHKL